jgi:PAS domain-containing protein
MSTDILDCVLDGVFTMDTEWRITAFNCVTEKITGIRRQDAIGQRCCDMFRAPICESACALKQMLAT